MTQDGAARPLMDLPSRAHGASPPSARAAVRRAVTRHSCACPLVGLRRERARGVSPVRPLGDVVQEPRASLDRTARGTVHVMEG